MPEEPQRQIIFQIMIALEKLQKIWEKIENVGAPTFLGRRYPPVFAYVGEGKGLWTGRVYGQQYTRHTKRSILWLRDRASLFRDKPNKRFIVRTVAVCAVVMLTLSGVYVRLQAGGIKFGSIIGRSSANQHNFLAKFGKVRGRIWKYIPINDPTPKEYSSGPKESMKLLSSDRRERVIPKNVVFGFDERPHFFSGLRTHFSYDNFFVMADKFFFGWFIVQAVTSIEVLDFADCGSRSAILYYRCKKPLPFAFFWCSGNVKAYGDVVNKSPLDRVKRFTVNLIRLSSGPPKEDIYEQESQGSYSNGYLYKFFPSGGIVFAPIGIVILGWGWWRIRDDRKFRSRAIAFVFGAVLWMYGLASILVWSAKP